MYVLNIDAFTRQTVSNPLMMKKGGGIGPGTYVRGTRNLVTSAGLVARNELIAETVARECGLSDKCLPRGMSRAAIGAPVPGNPGKTFRECDDAEAGRRLTDASACAKRVMSTKGGIYGSGAA